MINIIAKTDSFLLVDKPAGIDFHDCEGIPGLVTRMREQTGEDLWPVHRLDKITSGLILLARTKAACTELCQLFAEKKIEKFYLALSDRKPKKKQGWVIGDMQRSRRSSWMLTDTRNNPATTQFFSKSVANHVGMRIYLLRPLSGKTHQLRVALKSLGSAICGDDLYYPGTSSTLRCHLHAYALRFHFAGELHFTA